MKSPSRRLSSPMGVSTRRSSASPRGGGHGFVTDSSTKSVSDPPSAVLSPKNTDSLTNTTIPEVEENTVSTLGLLSSSQNEGAL